MKKPENILGFDLGIRIWLVTLARTKLAKENEPEEISKEFPSRREPSN